MRVALKHGGEVICADSRTVYKGLDTGTAKPSTEDRAMVPHHLLDVVEPDEVFSAAKFQRLAKTAINDIRARGKLPMLVGGTGLFVDGVLYDFEFGPPADVAARRELEVMSIAQLQEYCATHNIELPRNVLNKRHLVRAVEQKGLNSKRREQGINNAFVVGIAPYKEMLQKRIELRAETMFSSSVIKEATKAAKIYGWGAPGLSGNIYPIIRLLAGGEISRREAIDKFIRADWQLARRQMTWFRRNEATHWCTSPTEAEQLVDTHLANI